MIRSCRDRDTQLLLDRQFTRRFQAIERAARVRLALLDAATSLADLRLPGLRNDQFRICFEWRDGDAHNVEIVDYH